LADGHAWDVSKITDFVSVFSGLRNPRAEDFSEDDSNWDVSNQRDDHERNVQSNLSKDPAKVLANHEKEKRRNTTRGMWDVSKITDFDSVFSGLRNPRAEDFSEENSNWDVSSQRDDHERNVHWSLRLKNGDLSTCIVSSMPEMRGMYNEAASFNRNPCHWGSRMSPTALVLVRDMFTNTHPLSPQKVGML
jgi:hypothetical protein